MLVDALKTRFDRVGNNEDLVEVDRYSTCTRRLILVSDS